MKQTSEQKLETSSIYEGARLLFEYKKNSGISILDKTIIDRFQLERIPHLRNLAENKYLEFQIPHSNKRNPTKISKEEVLKSIKTSTDLRMKLSNIQWWRLARFAYKQITPFVIEESEKLSKDKAMYVLCEYIDRKHEKTGRRKVLLTSKDLGDSTTRINIVESLWNAWSNAKLDIYDINLSLPVSPSDATPQNIKLEFLVSSVKDTLLPYPRLEGNRLKMRGKEDIRFKTGHLNLRIIKLALDALGDFVPIQDLEDLGLKNEEIETGKVEDSIRGINNRFKEKLGLPKDGPNLLEFQNEKFRFLIENFSKK